MKTKMTKMLSCCFLVAGGLMMAGCSTDDNIDVGEVDTLLGVGTNGFTIPAGNSDPIQLINLFKLDDSDCIDTIAGGDYRFFKDDDGIDETDVKIDPVSVTLDANNIQTYQFILPIVSQYNTSGARAAGPAKASQKFNQTITTFDFTEKDLTGAIRELKKAEIDPVPFRLTEHFSGDLKNILSQFSGLDLELPDFFEIQNNKVTIENGNAKKTVDVVNGKIHLEGIYTAYDLVMEGKIVSMDFTKAKKTFGTDVQELKFLASKDFAKDLAQVIIKGLVFIDVTYDEQHLTFDPADFADVAAKLGGKTDNDFFIDSYFTIGEGAKPKMEFRDVTGRFFPDIDLNIDPVEIEDIPEFLTKDGVKIDLNDIFLELGVNSTMPLPGTVNVKMTPIINKSKKATITVNNILIGQNTNSKILISRKEDQTSKPGYTDYHWAGKQVDPNDPDKKDGDVGDLLTNIPDEIEFDCDAEADSANFYTVYLNKDYTIQPTYHIEAPLALQGSSCIIYDDSADEWNSDLNDNDIDLDGNTTLTVEGDIINNTPLDLEIDAPTPIGVGGGDISSIVKVTMPNNPLVISSKQTNKMTLTITTTGDGLKKLDGIKYAVKAKAAKDGTVQTLNGRTHTIQLKNLKAKIDGKITINLDK